MIKVDYEFTRRYAIAILDFQAGMFVRIAGLFRYWWLFAVGMLLSASLLAREPIHFKEIAVRDLPPEARATLSLIKQGGPFPYKKDGTVFGNYEKLLPQQRRGYYREFTVPTPGVRHRGARRIVSGGGADAPSEFFYTEDHYQSFKRIRE